MSSSHDWKPVAIRDITLKTRTWNPLTEPRETIKYVDVSAVSRETLEIDGADRILAATAPSRARKIIQTGDTIFATIRPNLKRVALVPPSCDDQLASTAFCVLRPNPAVVNPEYLFFAASNDAFVSQVAGFETGASYPAVRDGDIFNQEISLPPLPEQQQISNALQAARASMLHQIRSITIAQDLKRAAMATLFTRGLKGETQRETKIGLVPESWDVAAIGDVSLNTQYGLSIRGEPAGAYPILRMNCQEDGSVHYRNLQYVDLDQSTYEAFRLRPGDLLFNRTNSIELVGRMAIIDDERPAVFASYLVRLTVDDTRCLPRFLNYFMNWPATQAEIKKLASRAVGQANINASKLRTVLFPLPPTLHEQEEIVSTLDVIDRKIDLHKRKRAVLESLFKALLHKLMTGEIRVAELDLSALGKPSLEGAAA